ncbi:DUF4258 domain-containing protein [Hyphomicrobium sp. CS1BSMeth3]|uniref:DUF4258 domain-containing protein n=1 Tax=Hyphomicrobium sp. CS1BSMeth3 TaxID=1892844 RepID=UPI000931364D|nr:DUF4258 domain-containing protein [Hyphomicrobium sp. CS1BSMeth3]
MSETLTRVREHVRAGSVRVSQHAIEELFDDGISLEAVVDGVESALVVEDYPQHARGPCVLCLQRVEADRPVHVLWGIAAQNPDIATLITAYRPDPERWMDDLLTRRPR